jgi:hypothetical protein
MLMLTRGGIGAMALMAVLLAACSTSPAKPDSAHPPSPSESAIGQILRQHAVQRSLEQCKENALSDADCSATIAKAQAHLDSVNGRLEILAKDTKTNMCDLVRWAGSCNNPIYTLGDLADCLQTAVDRGEALNSGRFTLNLDTHGCPTDRK